MSDDVRSMVKRAPPKKSAPKVKRAKQAKRAPAKAKRSPAKPTRPAAKAKRPGKQLATRSATKRGTNAKNKATARFDVANVIKLVEHARKGDAHTILGIAAKLPIREVLSEPPSWTRKSYDRLLALYLGNDTFGHAGWDGYLHDFAEDTYFRHDDDGRLLAQLNSDLGAIHASRDFGVFDESRAVEYFRAALAGPRPGEVVVELEAVIAASPKPLPKLARLAANPEPED